MIQGVITRRELAHEWASTVVEIVGEFVTTKQNWLMKKVNPSQKIDVYETEFNMVMRLDDFELLRRVHERTGRWLNVITKNHYILY